MSFDQPQPRSQSNTAPAKVEQEQGSLSRNTMLIKSARDIEAIHRGKVEEIINNNPSLASAIDRVLTPTEAATIFTDLGKTTTYGNKNFIAEKNSGLLIPKAPHILLKKNHGIPTLIENFYKCYKGKDSNVKLTLGGDQVRFFLNHKEYFEALALFSSGDYIQSIQNTNVTDPNGYSDKERLFNLLEGRSAASSYREIFKKVITIKDPAITIPDLSRADLSNLFDGYELGYANHKSEVTYKVEEERYYTEFRYAQSLGRAKSNRYSYPPINSYLYVNAYPNRNIKNEDRSFINTPFNHSQICDKLKEIFETSLDKSGYAALESYHNTAEDILVGTFASK